MYCASQLTLPMPVTAYSHPAVHIVTMISLSPLNSFLLFRNIMDVPLKKTRTALTLETKFDIIQRLEGGETASSLGRIYNVNESSIRTIRKNAGKIRSYIAQSCSITTNKTVKNENLII